MSLRIIIWRLGTVLIKLILSFSLSIVPSIGFCQEKRGGDVLLSNTLDESFKSHAGSKTSFILLDLNSNSKIFGSAEQQPVKPASTLKLLTTLVALKRLGIDFSFTTEIFGLKDPGNSASLKKLILRGGGDPSLTIESLMIIVRKISTTGVKNIGEVVLDTSLFIPNKSPIGQRAYEATSSPVSFNFNSMTVWICPGQEGKPAIVTIDPPESGYLISGSVLTKRGGRAYTVDRFKDGSNKNKIHVGGTISPSVPCKAVYRSIEDPENYFGSTMLNLLNANGISIEKGVTISREQVNGGDLLVVHNSKPLPLVLWDLNHFSNNFIGSQLLYRIGSISPYQQDLKAGLQELENQLILMGVPIEQFTIVDGSGLSHLNRLSAYGLGKVLLEAYKDQSIQTEFLASLPVAGQSGTLKSRLSEDPLGVVRAKTGSLDGVSSLAGYIFRNDGRKYAFVLISNGLGRGEADNFHRKVVRQVIQSR